MLSLSSSLSLSQQDRLSSAILARSRVTCQRTVLISSTTSMSDDSFASESLIIECVLSSNEISYSLKSLIDIEAADYSFIDEVIAQIVYDQLQIEFLTLIKAKSIREFDDHYAKKLITHIIYLNLTVQDHTIDTASMLIT